MTAQRVATFVLAGIFAATASEHDPRDCVTTEPELASFFFDSTGESITLCSSTKSAPLELTRFFSVERKVSIGCEDGVDCQVLLSNRVSGFGVTDTGPLFMSGITFTSVSGLELARAAVDVDRDATATLKDVSFIGLAAFQGPALQIIGSGATAICDGCIFSNCTAATNGGALHITRGGSEFTCNQCTFSGNKASVRGGSIDTDQGSNVVNINDSTFNGDEAPIGKSVFVSEFTSLVSVSSDFEEITVQESSNDFVPAGGSLKLVRSSVGIVNSAPY